MALPQEPGADCWEAGALYRVGGAQRRMARPVEARWKGQTKSVSPASNAPQVGQVRSFRISRLDPDSKQIEIELA